MLERILDLIAPERSLDGTVGTRLTVEERREMFRCEPVQLHPVKLRAMGCGSLDRLVAASTYKHAPLLREAIYAMKYGNRKSYVEELGIVMAGAAHFLTLPLSLTLSPGEREHVALCPVPLHWMRRMRRGHNQAALLAGIVSELCDIPVADLLQRTRATGHQAWRSRQERKTALQGVFRCAVHPVPSHVVLVDDVATTGATLEACARVLKEQGAMRVEGLVVALG